MLPSWATFSSSVSWASRSAARSAAGRDGSRHGAASPAMAGWLIVPLYLIICKLGRSDTLFALILTMSVAAVPLAKPVLATQTAWRYCRAA